MTTSQKSSYSIPQWRNIFSTRGFENLNIKKLNKNSNNLNRREEIMKWINKGYENSFVIIDDDKFLNNLPYNVKSKLVQPSATVGLNDELADSAITILKSSERLAS